MNGKASTGLNCTAAKGAKVELEVAADLMDRGYYVYRNLSPTGPVDMIALHPNGQILKVQATVGDRGKTGEAKGCNSHQDTPLWDVLAVRYPDKVRYFLRSGAEIFSHDLDPPRPPAGLAPSVDEILSSPCYPANEKTLEKMWENYRG